MSLLQLVLFCSANIFASNIDSLCTSSFRCMIGAHLPLASQERAVLLEMTTGLQEMTSGPLESPARVDQ